MYKKKKRISYAFLASLMAVSVASACPGYVMASESEETVAVQTEGEEQELSENGAAGATSLEYAPIVEPDDMVIRASDKKNTAEKSIVQIAYGYQFPDGSFDTWLGGTGVYIGNGYILTGVNNTAFTGGEDERYLAALEAKRALYDGIGVKLSNFGTVTQSMVLYGIAPSGKATSATVVSTDESGIAILKTSLTDGDLPAVELVSDVSLRQGTVIGYSSTVLKDLENFSSASSGYAVGLPTKASVGILTRNGVISITGNVDNGMAGSAVVSDSGQVIGLVTSVKEDKAYAISADSFAKVVYDVAEIEVQNSTSSNLKKSLSDLNKEIEEVEGIDLRAYTDETAKALTEALDKAKETAADESLKAADYSAALSELTAAKEGLVERPKRPFFLTIPGIALIVLVLALISGITALVVKSKKEKKRKEDISWIPGEESDDDEPKKKKEKKKRAEKKKHAPEKKRTPVMDDDDEPGTGILNDDDEPGTGILNGGPMMTGRLTKCSTGTSYYIEKASYMIGRSKKPQIDLQIPENINVGRKHAKIQWKNGKYELCDLDSKNGTFVNDDRLKPDGTPVELHERDIVRFADEEFEFHQF